MPEVSKNRTNSPRFRLRLPATGQPGRLVSRTVFGFHDHWFVGAWGGVRRPAWAGRRKNDGTNGALSHSGRREEIGERAGAVGPVCHRQHPRNRRRPSMFGPERGGGRALIAGFASTTLRVLPIPRNSLRRDASDPAWVLSFPWTEDAARYCPFAARPPGGCRIPLANSMPEWRAHNLFSGVRVDGRKTLCGVEMAVPVVRPRRPGPPRRGLWASVRENPHLIARFSPPPFRATGTRLRRLG